MKSAFLFSFSLLLGLAWMLVDIQMTSHKEQTLNDFAKLSLLYTLQIEKNDFVYRKKNE